MNQIIRELKRQSAGEKPPTLLGRADEVIE
jgi:hypothetical protein